MHAVPVEKSDRTSGDKGSRRCKESNLRVVSVSSYDYVACMRMSPWKRMDASPVDGR
jgi:hypothetical protein